MPLSSTMFRVLSDLTRRAWPPETVPVRPNRTNMPHLRTRFHPIDPPSLQTKGGFLSLKVLSHTTPAPHE